MTLFINIAHEHIERYNNDIFSKATYEGYQHDLKTFLKYAESVKGTRQFQIEEITRPFLRSYLDWLSDNYAYKSALRKLTVLRGILNYAEDSEYIDKNPIVRMRLIKPSTYKKQPSLSMIEINRILFYAHNEKLKKYGDYIRERDIAILELLFYTGMRVGEIVNLKVKNWNELDHSLTFISKGKKERKVYIDNIEVLDSLINYLKCVEKYNVEYIFITNKLTKMSTGAVRDIVTKYAKIANINHHITPHSFRRSFGTLLIANGADISYVKEALGHASISTTQRYIMLDKESIRREVDTKNPRNLLSVC